MAGFTHAQCGAAGTWLVLRCLSQGLWASFEVVGRVVIVVVVDGGGVCGMWVMLSRVGCCGPGVQAGAVGSVSKVQVRRRLAGGELPLSCCALTRDAKIALAGESVEQVVALRPSPPP